ncbi:hypothetical protein [Roseibium sp. SCP14]|uniref:hypothetical protein n=1 Tax=Roseibium sp. SCP14 TaxID=3141375 RepID=UPI00333747D2
MKSSDVFTPQLGNLLLAFVSLLSKRTVCVIAVLSYLSIVLVTLAIGYLKPDYNWDLLPYVAAASEDQAADVSELHALAYSAVREAATDGQYQGLIADIPYRVSQFENPDNFVSMLPMYRVKVGYVAAVRALGGPFGFVQATTIISFASAALVAFFILIWCIRESALQGLLIIGPAMILLGFTALARAATPDLLMATFSVPAIYFVCRRQPLFASVFLILMMLVRPDGILLFFALLLASLATRVDRLAYLALFVLAVALYVWATGSSGHPGWWPHFYFSNIEVQNNMDGFAPPFNLLLYVKALIFQLIRSIVDNDWLALFVLFLLGFALLLRNGWDVSPGQWTAVIALTLCTGGKFVTFPLPDDRVYLPYLLPLLLVLMEIWKPEVSCSGTKPHAKVQVQQLT